MRWILILCSYAHLSTKIWSIKQYHRIIWEFIRNAEFQVPPQMHRIRICILTKSPQNYYAHWSSRSNDEKNAWSTLYGKHFYSVWPLSNFQHSSFGEKIPSFKHLRFPIGPETGFPSSNFSEGTQSCNLRLCQSNALMPDSEQKYLEESILANKVSF